MLQLLQLSLKNRPNEVVRINYQLQMYNYNSYVQLRSAFVMRKIIGNLLFTFQVESLLPLSKDRLIKLFKRLIWLPRTHCLMTGMWNVRIKFQYFFAQIGKKHIVYLCVFNLKNMSCITKYQIHIYIFKSYGENITYRLN